MKLAIQQTVKLPSHSREGFEDWLEGQHAIASTTGFLFAVLNFNSRKVLAYYLYQGDAKGIWPALSRGQTYVWVD